MEKNIVEPSSAEELFRQILEREEQLSLLTQKMSKLIQSRELNHQRSSLLQAMSGPGAGGVSSFGPITCARVMKLTDTRYLNILQSMGQAIHMYDRNHRIFFWNRAAENLFGFTAVEAIGNTPEELLVEPKYLTLAGDLIERSVQGESMSGEFFATHKNGHKVPIIATNTPLIDENQRLIGAMCVVDDARPYQVMNPPEECLVSTTHQPQQTSIPSKISNLVKMKMATRGDDQGKTSTSYGHISLFPFGVLFFAGKLSIGSIQAEACINNRTVWPWKEKDNIVSFDKMEASRMRFLTFNVSSANSSTSGRTSIKKGSTMLNFKRDINCYLDFEILWEDLTIKQQIGQGSCGIVYHALWYGSDVAVKLFASQELADGVILSFKHEVSIMKRLRHPNILLFMGAVTSPHHLGIVTEFLRRGSLFRILERNSTQLDWRRHLRMAMDIARGMNYLHHCNPPIVHRDLKSSNLLVDKNWNVKVGDFGISCIKHQTYLKTNSGKGTPQWMAPEVLRNEQADEKSDVYSYGVVLWEIITRKIPWDDLDPMQVIGAVGFRNQRLEIPNDVHPLWTSLIESCWRSKPQSRPTFQEIIYKLKDIQKQFAIECRR